MSEQFCKVCGEWVGPEKGELIIDETGQAHVICEECLIDNITDSQDTNEFLCVES